MYFHVILCYFFEHGYLFPCSKGYDLNVKICDTLKTGKNTLWFEFFVVVHFYHVFKYSSMKIIHIWASQVHFVKLDIVVTLKFWPWEHYL